MTEIYSDDDLLRIRESNKFLEMKIPSKVVERNVAISAAIETMKSKELTNEKLIRDLREKVSTLEKQCDDSHMNAVILDLKRGKHMSDEDYRKKVSALEKRCIGTNGETDYAGFTGSTSKQPVDITPRRTRSGSYHEPVDCTCGPGNSCMCPPASDKQLHASAPFNRPPSYGQTIYSSAPRTVPPPLVPINNNFSSISNMFGCNCSRLKKCTCVDVKGYSSVTGDEAC